MLSRGKRIIFNIVLAGLLLAITEGASFALIRYQLVTKHPERLAFDFSNVIDTLKQHEIDSYAQALWDPILGWSFQPGMRRENMVNSIKEPWSIIIDEQGSRYNPYRAESRGIISIYGDSYGFADEVREEHSWQAYLSILTDVNVENFSVGAAAPDQGVYRLEHDLAAGKRPKIVFLAIHTENIKNILSAYRRFYNPNDGHVIGFKPVLEEKGDGWVWVPPELREHPTNPTAIAAAIAHAARHDVFYKNNAALPRDTFPYTLQAFRYLRFLLRTEVLRQSIYLRYGGDSRELWSADLPRRRMEAIIDRFVALGEKYGFTPVALFIPEGPDVKAFKQNGIEPPYGPLATAMARRHTGKLIVADVLTRNLDANRFNLAPFFAHPSPYGNRVIASAAFAAIQGLPPLAGRPPETPGIEPGVGGGLADFASGRCRVVPPPNPGLLRALVPENATAQPEGDDLIVDASNNDPILFVPRGEANIERVRVTITPPAPTDLELYVITDAKGYTQKPYRVALGNGRNEVDIDLEEREPLRLRLDPGMLPGRYRLHGISFLRGCEK